MTRTKPDDHSYGAFLDVAHQRHLFIPLGDIELVDADGVDAKKRFADARLAI